MGGITSKSDDWLGWPDLSSDPELLFGSVGLVAAQFLHFEGRPFYPAGALQRSKVLRVWLGTGASSADSASDLIFKMPPFEDQPSDFNLFEFVLRTTGGAAYGGWAFGDRLTILSEFFAGHRIVESEFRGEKLRFSYDPSLGRYQYLVGDLSGLSTGQIRALAKARQRD